MRTRQDIPPIDIDTITTRFETSTLDVADLVVAAAALVGGFVLGAIARTVVRRALVSVPGIQEATATVIGRIVGYVVIVFGLVTALSAIGLDFGPVITILLFASLVSVLIGRPLLADLGAAVVLQSRRPVVVGDVLRVADTEGVVEDIDARVVRLRTWDGWQVRVRNSEVLNEPIVRAGRPGVVRVEFVAGLDYGTDLDRAVDVVATALAEVPGVRSDPRPRALVSQFGESTIDVRCWLWTEAEGRWFVQDEAMRATKRALDAAGIVIAFPQRVLHGSPAPEPHATR